MNTENEEKKPEVPFTVYAAHVDCILASCGFNLPDEEEERFLRLKHAAGVSSDTVVWSLVWKRLNPVKIPSHAVKLSELPKCDLCRTEVARFDAQMKGRTHWAYLCIGCRIQHTLGRLGVGVGQVLITLEEAKEAEDENR